MFTNFCEKSGNEAVKKKQEVKSRLLVTYKNQYRIIRRNEFHRASRAINYL